MVEPPNGSLSVEPRCRLGFTYWVGGLMVEQLKFQFTSWVGGLMVEHLKVLSLMVEQLKFLMVEQLKFQFTSWVGGLMVEPLRSC